MSPQRQTILVADDDPHVRAILVRRLQRLGYRVVEARDGEDALAQVARERPSLLLVDRTMPRVDGDELIRRLRADPGTASLPIVVLSARADGSGPVADAYLPKPFLGEELAEALGSLLD